MYLRLLSYIKPYRTFFILSFITMIIFALMSGFSLGMISPLVITIFSKNGNALSLLGESNIRILKIIDRWMFESSPLVALKRLSLIIIILFFLKGLFQYLHTYFNCRVEQGVIKDIRNHFYKHIHTLSLGFFSKSSTGNLSSIITNDVEIVRESVSKGFIEIVRESTLILIYTFLVIWASWRLAILSIIVVPLSILLIAKAGKKLRKRGTRIQERMGDIMATFTETISGIRIVKAFAMEHFELKKFFRNSFNYLKTVVHFEALKLSISPLTEFLGAIAASIILLYGGYLILVTQTLSPDRFFVFLAASLSLMQPIKRIGAANSNIQRGLGAAKRIFEILDKEKEIKEYPDSIHFAGLTKHIKFRNVSFRYDSGSPVLNNICLEVKAGQIVAIVGPSGAGKSTIINLIPRFFEPTSGTIEIDGINLRKFSLKSLRQAIGLVTQETILFNDTIFNNIAYGRSEISRELVMKISKAANAHNFIERFPDGYDTVIGERGTTLSGGEKQRIAIARALLKDPPILIFDEATSALDAESQLLVQEAIHKLMEGRTTIVIAHRLSTIKDVDLIYVVDGGKLVGCGTHRELLQQEGIYRRLYKHVLDEAESVAG
ncbi:MAG: ATP-binding cassette domain-containing protein [Candidatus Cloacimonadota bacterium]|nr:MAG: ATP-binding cassette domain-containing protein [Candidatus Cloacimonadota bacterium]